MIRENGEPADQSQVAGTRFMQCRLPVALYEWLRLRAFVGRTSMNSIVLDAIEEMKAASEAAPPPPPAPREKQGGTSAGIKFNVRLTEATYEWLRTRAFHSRGSINQLLIGALDGYRLRQEASS